LEPDAKLIADLEKEVPVAKLPLKPDAILAKPCPMRSWFSCHKVPSFWFSFLALEAASKKLTNAIKTAGPTSKPSSLMPLAASVERAKTFTRKHFGLPEDTYLFLYVFDFNSHLKRKNPQAAIKAFQEAFSLKGAKVKSTSDVSKVGLVFKVMNTKQNNPDWLEFEKLIAGDERITVINKTLDREEILGLIKVCDAYVSPHRAEGFGRTLAEAMLFGKPVIATNYSGNTFYMHPELTLPVQYQLMPMKKGDYHFVEDEDGAVWAEPSIPDMATQMLWAIEKSQEPSFKKQLEQYALDTFSPLRTGRLMKKRLEKIQIQLELLAK
jgi:glycosyltransferase involved in cell wall biosynthesis